jgi:hypothetical protein
MLLVFNSPSPLPSPQGEGEWFGRLFAIGTVTVMGTRVGKAGLYLTCRAHSKTPDFVPFRRGKRINTDLDANFREENFGKLNTQKKQKF